MPKTNIFHTDMLMRKPQNIVVLKSRRDQASATVSTDSVIAVAISGGIK
jgi:hypothetical protein